MIKALIIGKLIGILNKGIFDQRSNELKYDKLIGNALRKKLRKSNLKIDQLKRLLKLKYQL